MLDEQAPTLLLRRRSDAYADSLIARFSNPALKHRTWQIAMDGSQKLPQRMLDGIRVHLQRGSRWPLLALGVAGWMRYVSGTDDAGQAIDVRDPLAIRFRLWLPAAATRNASAPCWGWKKSLAATCRAMRSLSPHHRRLASACAVGARQAIANVPDLTILPLADRILLSAVALLFPLFSSG
jgi:fructuronate reductase